MDNNRKDKRQRDLTILDFKALKILVAGRDDILSWSYGEVTKPETINYRTLRAEKDGLFDERIFGPTKDWECYCGKYKRIRYRGIVCDKCGVEVTLSRVRRERLGHITLSAPVSHVWFFKGANSALSLLLDIPQKNLESVIYYASYVVTNVDEVQKNDAMKSFEEVIEKRRIALQERMAQEEARLTQEAEDKKKETDEGSLSKEQKQLINQETDLTLRQKLARVGESLESETKKLEEIADTLLKLLKGLKPSSVLSEDEYFKILEYDIPVFFTIKTGSEALLELVKGLNLSELIAQLRQDQEKASGARYLKVVKRLRLIENMRKSGINPESMIVTVLPVIPPDLRPMVQLAGGRFATSDLNDLYRRVINRNNRLHHLISLGAPEIILRNEKRMLQESVDSLIDSTQRGQVAAPLRSLSDMLRGKQGRFRQNLLGKRVDYSGRSVIVVGPDLKLTQCGLPKEMALEMFKPFVLREIIVRGLATNIKSAKRYIEKRPPEVFDILEEITRNHPVLLNRAPTLHKLGMQAFYPVLIEGAAIQLHPCVCTGYNADFDGDQMAVHIPLSQKAQQEAIELMMPVNNLLKPADGTPITLPNKEMALGVFYLTQLDERLRKSDEEMSIFSTPQEALLAYDLGKARLKAPIKVRTSLTIGSDNVEIIETSVGRLMFNELLPNGFTYLNEAVGFSAIKKLITKAMRECGSSEEVANLIDTIKHLGFKGATVSGLSLSAFDNVMVTNKQDIIDEAEVQVTSIEDEYQQGLITLDERKRLSNEIWMKYTDLISDNTWKIITPDNPIRTFIDSGGSRAGIEQMKQVSGMRGLIYDPLGRIVELPIKSNFREGLSIFEYVASARGSRKGLTDSALKTANAGYLTRRLVDVSHDVIIREADCGTDNGILIQKVDKERTSPFGDRLLGRFLGQDVKVKDKLLFAKGTEIVEEVADALASEESITELIVRSPLTCKLAYGMCSMCYGWDFSTKKLVTPGVPVGVVAAQSIGEPGTQLTMKVKHFGGIVMSDVTQGLPRIEELFEMRTPKNLAPVSEISGKVSIEQTEEGYLVHVKNSQIKPVEEQEYFVPLSATLSVEEGQEISAGTPLAEGYLDPKEVLKIGGLLNAQRYVLTEAQKVYESQGIGINDKHFEVVLRKMSDKVIIETVGDTALIPGDFVTKARFETINAEVLAEGGEPSTGRQMVLGITKAALFSDSWMSAASFQNTTTVLTEAALEGREDHLLGLKENVIIGRLIPVDGNNTTIEEEVSEEAPLVTEPVAETLPSTV